MTTELELSPYKAHTFIKSETNKRVSPSAGTEMAKEMQEHAQEISDTATQIAENQGRETVRKDDIKQALRQHR